MKIKKKYIIQNLYIIFIIVYPILNNYKLGIPIGDTIALLLMPIFILSKRNNNGGDNLHDKYYYFYLIYCVITLPLLIIISSSFDFKDTFSKMFHLILYAVYGLYFGNKFFDLKLFFEKYLKVLNILVLLAIVQQIIYLFTKSQVYLIIPNLPLNYTIENSENYIRVFTQANSIQGYRASSLFLEPSHFAIFVVIGLAYKLLNDWKKNRDIITIVLYLISIACSYSSIGIICSIIIIGYYMIFYKAVNKKSKNFIFKIFVMIIFVASIIYILSTNSLLIKAVLDRINGIGSKLYDTSGNRRILRGYYIWKDLPFFNKIIGTGMGNLLETIKLNKMLVLTDMDYTDEMSALFYNLCSVGVIGTVLYFSSIMSNWKTADAFVRLIIILYVFSCLFNNILLHATSIIFLVIIFSKRNKVIKYDS